MMKIVTHSLIHHFGVEKIVLGEMIGPEWYWWRIMIMMLMHVDAVSGLKYESGSLGIREAYF